MYNDYKVSNIVEEVVEYYEKKIRIFEADNKEGVEVAASIMFYAAFILAVYHYPSIAKALCLWFTIDCMRSTYRQYERNRMLRSYRDAIKEARLAEVHYEMNKALRETSNVRNIDSLR